MKVNSNILRSAFVLPIIFLIATFIQCSQCQSYYQYNEPQKKADGIETGSILETDLDTAIIANGIRKIKCGKFNEIHSLLIYKDDKLVLEEYFWGHAYQWDAPHYFGKMIEWNRDMSHQTMSCSKSYVSACIGIAIEKGFIKSTDESIFKYLPDHQLYNSEGRENITIEHLLTMTSGLAWNEWSDAHGTSANDIDRLYFECYDDPLKCVLERPLTGTPGETFTYSGGNTVVLGEVIRNASGLNLDEFSMKYLFKPMGIDSTYWYYNKNGVIAADGSLEITPRDMLKLGITYLNNGKWNGVQLIPEDWIKKSYSIYSKNKDINIPIEDSGKNGYAYGWWVSQLPLNGKDILMYRANGWGGQTIMVFPEIDMVLVTTGGNYAMNSYHFKLLKKYILPAIRQNK